MRKISMSFLPNALHLNYGEKHCHNSRFSFCSLKKSTKLASIEEILHICSPKNGSQHLKLWIFIHERKELNLKKKIELVWRTTKMLTASCARIENERLQQNGLLEFTAKAKKNLFFLLRIFIKSQELVFYFNVSSNSNSSIARQASIYTWKQRRMGGDRGGS